MMDRETARANLAALLAEMEAENGPVPEADVAATAALWPDAAADRYLDRVESMTDDPVLLARVAKARTVDGGAA